MSAASRKANAVLVINVGGTHVKVLATGQRDERKILSGSSMTASKMVRDIKRVTKNWEYGLVSIGFPGPVIHGCPLHEPYNLGSGWVGFDFAKAFGCPVKVQRAFKVRTGLTSGQIRIRPCGLWQ
jgi:predicted NBD/HSP70 family sugar kinase